MTKRQIARSYLDDLKIIFKNNKTKLAEHILRNHPKKFKDIEDARQVVRSVTDANGSQVSKQDKTFNLPKIFVFDIETLPIVSMHWRMWKENISQDQVLQDWCMLSWSGKWLFDSEMHSEVLTPTEAKKRNDKRIVRKLWNFFEDANVIIAHNLKKFDRKKSNSRFILNGMKPPTPYEMIDTLEIARKEFGMSSNRLNYLGQILVGDKKIKTDFDLWKDCHFGSQEALTQMATYNDQDVLLLEEVYLELRPWMKSHPNLAKYGEMDREVCTYCGGDTLNSQGVYGTPAGLFQSYRCVDCGGINRSRYSMIGKDEKKNLLTSTAR